MKSFGVHLPRVAKQFDLKIKVTGVRRFRVRVWLGVQVLKLAAIVMGVGFEVSVEKQP